MFSYSKQSRNFKPFETNQQMLMKMSRKEIINYKMLYKIEFTCGVRGHHVYKTTWTPVLNEKLDCKKDNREVALSQDKHSVGVFKKDGTLVGHIPIELSRLIYGEHRRKFRFGFGCRTKET